MSKEVARHWRNLEGRWKDHLIESLTEITVEGQRYRIEQLLSRAGWKSVVFSGKDRHDGQVVIKIAMGEDYSDGRSVDDELGYSARLRGIAEIVELKGGEMKDLVGPGGEVRRFAVFVSPKVEGSSLRKFIDEGTVSPIFIRDYIGHMCRVMALMRERGICHDDLHADNVLVSQDSSTLDWELRQWGIRIIDLGSMKALDAQRKPMDDHGWFASHIVELVNACLRRGRPSMTPADYVFLQGLQEILARMTDPDMRALTEPAAIHHEVRRAWSRAFQTDAEEHGLDRPFEGISAELLTSDHVVAQIFAEKLPWIPAISSSEPVWLTGPRGAGKSMVFRRYSMRGQLAKSVGELRSSPIAGVLIGCGSELKSRFNWLQDASTAAARREEILHIFNLVAARELVAGLRLVVEKAPELVPEDQSFLQVATYLAQRFRLQTTDAVWLLGSRACDRIYELLGRELVKAQSDLAAGRRVPTPVSAEFIGELGRKLREEYSFFRSHRFTLLIDDLSARQIPTAVQSILNEILLQRSEYFVCKINSDKYGWLGRETSGPSFDLQREYKVIDCADEFYAMEPARRKDFIIELINRRLEAVGWKGRAESLFGTSNYEGTGNSVQGEIRWASEETGRNVAYHGLQTLSLLCCGDISTVVDLAHRIISDAGTKPSDTTTIPKPVQGRAIDEASKDYLRAVDHYVPFGREMGRLARLFGTLSSRIAREGGLNHEGHAKAVPRVEIDGDVFSGRQEDKATLIVKEMIQRCVFVEQRAGRARHDNTTSSVLRLRPILAPALRAPLGKGDAVKWKPDDFWGFVADPEAACTAEFAKWNRTGPPQAGLKDFVEAE